ncbi:hypothetical protein BaRGS_00000975 [Batillaria attramentaria]|uniref:Uncharacterized protein n=1 Tax=Batillaria attramentaria TaxID=370345 RepID=A0ABD0M7U3_9CAEN
MPMENWTSVPRETRLGGLDSIVFACVRHFPVGDRSPREITERKQDNARKVKRATLPKQTSLATEAQFEYVYDERSGTTQNPPQQLIPPLALLQQLAVSTH